MSAKGGREAVLARLLSTTILLLACLAATCSVGFAQAGGEHWVGTWATAPVALVSGAPSPMPVTPANFKNQTLRQIVHVSAGGASVRVVFSNVFGTAPLEIGAAHIGRRDKGAAIVRGSDRVLTFGGNLAATIPAGAVMFSDAAKLDVAELSDLVVDLFLPGDTAASTSPLTVHSSSRQTNYVSPEGNYAGAVEITNEVACNPRIERCTCSPEAAL